MLPNFQTQSLSLLLYLIVRLEVKHLKIYNEIVLIITVIFTNCKFLELAIQKQIPVTSELHLGLETVMGF